MDLYLAEKSYREALSTQMSKPIIASLKTLTLLDPGKYQEKLSLAEKAITELQKAKYYMVESNFYLAYLVSHKSYRTLPTKESKNTLINSGLKLRYVVSVQANIVKSFQYLPKKIPELLSKYQRLPILEWDLIEINSAIGQLGKAAKALNTSLLVIEREKNSRLFPEIKKWKTDIHNQLEMINQTQQHLINIALGSSAGVLEKLNVELTEASANLLSLVREGLAEAAMRPYFVKAKIDFEPYANLAINLSLASSSTQRNSHAKWYRHWSSIEIEVLENSGSFSEYPRTFPDREKALSFFKKASKRRMPDLEQGFLKLGLFVSKHENIYGLIEKLSRDRMILDYGQSSS